MDQFFIRNFAIIAHVDHGKSTLSDRILELTGTVEKRLMREQVLDSHPIERERGVTIKLAPVTMHYTIRGTNYMLNLIDTPGHVDFSYEVERSLVACEGAVLLVDVTQGVQAQTIAHLRKAQQANLVIIPTINKIDIASAGTEDVLHELSQLFEYQPNDVCYVSAKTGQGVPLLLDRIVTTIPSPGGASAAPLRALVFNSSFDSHLGVIAFVRIIDGQLQARQKLTLLSSNLTFNPKEIGIFSPQRKPIHTLSTGQVGYVATGLKTIQDIHVGDTITIYPNDSLKQHVHSLPGYKEPKPAIYADVYPAEGFEYQQLTDAVARLGLSDSSLSSKSVFSNALGPGLRLGFLGLFHVDITKQRLKMDYGIPTILSVPTVSYLVRLTNGLSTSIENPNDLPDSSAILEILEPQAQVTIMTPSTYIGPLMKVFEQRRGNYQSILYLGNKAQLRYIIPLSELITGTFDEVKSVSSGYATVDYEYGEFAPVDAVKLSIMINHEPVDSLTRIVVRGQAERIGRSMVEKLKEILPAQQFAVPIQAAIGSSIIARETKKALRKDVTAKLYGGDQTRKDKLLKKQKKGKKRMEKFGKVTVSDTVITTIARLR